MIKTTLLILFLALLYLPVNAGETLNLSLTKAKMIALENNRDIQINKRNVEISKGDILKEKGVFDPLLNFTTSYTDSELPSVSTFIESGSINREDFNLESGISGSLPTGTTYNILNFSLNRTETDSPLESLSPSLTTNLSFSIGQELLRNFGKAINETPIFIAKRNLDITVDQLKNTISDVIFNVERDYWILVAAQKNLELEIKALELAVDLQNRNEIQVEVGVLAPVAVTQAKSEVASRKVDLINAENLMQQSSDILKNRLSLPLGTVIVPTDKPNEAKVNLDEVQITDEAMEKRPEINQANNEIEKSKSLVNFYSNQRLPQLKIEGTLLFQGLGGDENTNRLVFSETPEPIPSNFNNQSDSFDNLFGRDFPTWTILGSLNFPIFNRVARGEYIKAKADLSKRIIEQKKVKETVALEVRDSLREVRNSIRSVEATKVAVELAEEVVSNEEEKLKVGLSTTRDLLEAQRDLIDAQVAEIRAITNYNIALVSLEKAKGTILEANGLSIKENNIFYESR